MQVILREDVPNVGKMGELVNVKPGFGRNYLIPRGLALVATERNTRQLQHDKRVIEQHDSRRRKDAESVKAKIESLSLTIAKNVGEDEKLFGSVTSATPDGRRAWSPLSEGISPVQGADRHGPTAVLKSAARMDHVRTGGTLLNQKFTPALLADEIGLDALVSLIRAYFKLDGHHIQFNVVDAGTLRKAQ
jgi:pyruvate-formate lyase